MGLYRIIIISWLVCTPHPLPSETAGNDIRDDYVDVIRWCNEFVDFILKRYWWLPEVNFLKLDPKRSIFPLKYIFYNLRWTLLLPLHHPGECVFPIYRFLFVHISLASLKQMPRITRSSVNGSVLFSLVWFVRKLIPLLPPRGVNVYQERKSSTSLPRRHSSHKRNETGESHISLTWRWSDWKGTK